MQKGLSHAIYLRALVAEILGVDPIRIPIKTHTDSNDLFQAVKSTKFVKDKRQRLDITLIKQDVQKEQVEVRWVEAGDMLADPLTKKNAGAEQLLKVLETGQQPVGVTEKRMDKVIRKEMVSE